MTDAMTSKNGTFEERSNLNNTFIYTYSGRFSSFKNNSIGVKSYHFSPHESYINYEGMKGRRNEEDFGMEYPDRKYFVNAKLDLEKRRFTGQIDWEEYKNVYNKPKNTWDIDIQFSKDWKKIESGTKLITFRWGNNVTFTYGKDLIYNFYDTTNTKSTNFTVEFHEPECNSVKTDGNGYWGEKPSWVKSDCKKVNFTKEEKADA